MSPDEKFILLAEDDAAVAELVLHTLATHTPAPRVVHVRDGVEALDFLYSRRQYENRTGGQPCLVLLDLKMPRVDGLEVLRQLKSDADLKSTPVVMLTSSQDDRDVRQSYQLGANAYVVKPVEFRRFALVLQQLELFWLGINQPPPDRHRTFAEARAS
ncbi:MAG: response regulator [Verrucomicrobiota bacterium]